MIYLAAPYSHESPLVRSRRFHAVTLRAATLTKAGYQVYSPITHCHPIARAGGIEGTFDVWQAHCLFFLEYCSSFQILKLPDWQHSRGLNMETRRAASLCLPITEVNPTDQEFAILSTGNLHTQS